MKRLLSLRPEEANRGKRPFPAVTKLFGSWLLLFLCQFIYVFPGSYWKVGQEPGRRRSGRGGAQGNTLTRDKAAPCSSQKALGGLKEGREAEGIYLCRRLLSDLGTECAILGRSDLQDLAILTAWMASFLIKKNVFTFRCQLPLFLWKFLPKE